MLSERDLASLYEELKTEPDTKERDTRYDVMRNVLNKNWNLEDAGGEQLEPVSPNMVAVAGEDTADASSVMPTVRIRPLEVNSQAKTQAGLMEQVAVGSYFEHSKVRQLIPAIVRDLAFFGLSPLVVMPDYDRRSPIIMRRQPWTAYYEKRMFPHDLARMAVFARTVKMRQLPKEYQAFLKENFRNTWAQDTKEAQKRDLVLIEYFDDDEICTGVLWGSTGYNQSGRHSWTPVILDRVRNPIERCPVVIMQRGTWDDQPRGLFDDVLDTMMAHAKMMAMAVDYSDQAVYSDVWARDVIGQVPFGGGSFIELGPNGAIGRVPPAVSSLDIWRDLDRLEQLFHMGGRWPRSRPGEVDQSIASGKFVEATIGMMSTVIKSMHLVLSDGLAAALRLSFATDKEYFPGEKQVNGTVRNQDYHITYDPSKDVHLGHEVKVEYGLGLGLDPQSSAVLMINYAKEGYISDEFVQESIEGITDVERERKRIDLSKLKEMIFAALLQAVEAGEIPKSKLPEIYEARERGKDLVEIMKEHLATPPTDVLSQILGMGGGARAGAPGAPGGGQGRGALAELPVPPPPPDAARMLARIQGNRATLGAQVAG